MCMSTQYAQPLSCDARARTSSCRGASRLVLRDASSSAFIAFIICGTSSSTAERIVLEVVTRSDRGSVCVVMRPTVGTNRPYAKVQYRADRLDHFRSRPALGDGR